MSVTSISRGLPPSYNPVSGNNPQTAKSAPADGATAGRAASGGSGSGGGRSSTGAALYKQVSQMGTHDPSTSALLRNWNSIMQTGDVGGEAGAAAEPSGLHVTA
jgi:hypothetical protein